MKSNPKWLREAGHCCAEIAPDDGIDPRILTRTYRVSGRSNPKDLQLCKCAERTIRSAFAGECVGTGLEDLLIRQVEFSTDGRSLIVYLMVPQKPNFGAMDSIAARLGRIKGYIRTLIAQTVRRKRVPALRFRLSGSGEPGIYEKEI